VLAVLVARPALGDTLNLSLIQHVSGLVLTTSPQKVRLPVSLTNTGNAGPSFNLSVQSAGPFGFFLSGTSQTSGFVGPGSPSQPTTVALVYQINVVVPQVLDNDAVPLSFNVGGVAGAQTLYIVVHQ